MENFDINKAPLSDDEPVPIDDEPIPFDDVGADSPTVSHSPLSLGGEDKGPVESKQIEKKEPLAVASTERITGVRTFFTKLHGGAIEFLEGQITEWLKKNPGIVIKRTNVTTGEVAAKKTEPNLIVMVWY